MNKYIKKCLVVYSALALILVGMAGVTYAITATDADNYVTRSQYAVDMAHLQNKLDEQEAGLMGNINRYRSTDVKFVTYDMPNKPASGRAYNGGNWFPAPRNGNTTFAGTTTFVSRGMTGTNTSSMNAIYSYVSLHRLWNGNYYISSDKKRQTINSSGVSSYYGSAYHCAVPCENLPGYYLVIQYYGSTTTSLYTNTALHKLDPSVAPLTAAQLDAAGYLKFRFKKDLWRFNYTNYNESSFPVSIGTAYACTKYTNQQGDPLSGVFNYQVTDAATANFRYGRSIDPITGDYIVEVSGFQNAYANNNSALFYTSMNAMFPLVPVDNVEYLMQGLVSFSSTYSGMALFPPIKNVSTGVSEDAQWEYEFVDCVNGIKYFHGYKKPSTAYWTTSWHFSLPIVY